MVAAKVEICNDYGWNTCISAMQHSYFCVVRLGISIWSSLCSRKQKSVRNNTLCTLPEYNNHLQNLMGEVSLPKANLRAALSHQCV